MKKILILGAGKSSGYLIDYLIDNSSANDFFITVADLSKENVLAKTKNRPNTQAVACSFENKEFLTQLVTSVDIVVSMFPPSFHVEVAKMCLHHKKHLITPSYVSDEMAALHKDVLSSDLLFLNEVGLDPGIDHMSTMKTVNELRCRGAEIIEYKSHCGGLVAPDCDNNSWHYKFSWNPRNVILAGQGKEPVKYLQQGELKQIAYQDLFKSVEQLVLSDYGLFESYPNRDSLKYIHAYGLEEISTMYRGTLRKPPFCKGWATLIEMGLTTSEEKNTTQLRETITSVIGIGSKLDFETKQLVYDTGIVEAIAKVDEEKVIPADFLQTCLERVWKLKEGDRDLVVMIHEFGYKLKGKNFKQTSTLYIEGESSVNTAMAKTVGLPIAIAVKLVLNRKVTSRGVLIPTFEEIYNPILAELYEYGIEFKELTTEE